MIAEWLTCKVTLLVYNVILWLINIKPIRYIIRRMASSPGKVTIRFPGHDVWGFEKYTPVDIDRCPKCGERQVGRGVLWGVYIVGDDEKGKVADKVTEQFGIRTIEFSPVFGLKLNGKKVILKGIANHHTLGALGAAAYPRAIEKRIKMLKEFGFNHIRC